jgi:phosphatidylinositol-3-phosphatase
MILNQKWLASSLAILLAAILLAFAIGVLHTSANLFGYQPATAATAHTVPAFKHIFVIVMENEDYREIIGSNKSPYMTGLAQQYGVAAHFYGIRHPSLPNYMAMTGGDTFGISSDCSDCFVDAPNLVDQLEAGGKSWKAYMEDMPRACFAGDAPPLYRQKHNPFMYYDDVRTDPARCNKIVPFTQFAADVQAKTLPDFVWITPNMCNDMHDCPVSAGDSWLKTWVPSILESPAWKDGGALFITFDEGTGAAGCCGNAIGGQIATLVISPLGRPGFVSNVSYTHYSLLRTIEAAWHLPLLGRADCDCAAPMADFFQPEAGKP